MTKQETLTKFLGIKKDDIEETNWGFEVGDKEYSVLTDKEASKQAKEYILDSVWAFNAWFLANHMPKGVETDIIELAQEKCEDANETLKAMIIDLDKFVNAAICIDGRGHFLSSYDGEENQRGEYFIYRTN